MNLTDFTTENLEKLAPLVSGNTQKLFEGELAQRDLNTMGFLVALKGLEELLPTGILEQVEAIFKIERCWYRREKGLRYASGFIAEADIDLLRKEYRFGINGRFGKLRVEKDVVYHEQCNWTFATFMLILEQL